MADFAGLTRATGITVMAARANTSTSSLIQAALSQMHQAAYSEMAKQTQQAVAESDVVVFVVDARAGLSGAGP